MTYKEVVDWLFSQLPNYQKEGKLAYKPGLGTIRSVLNQLDNPQKKFKSIHVAGTNGKGSVSHILASVFIENNYKVGLFTSPHIFDFRERIKINGNLISEEYVIDFVSKNKNNWAEIAASFFEITTAMAFSAFDYHDCDIAIIETGLGGRLDSTNVLDPELSIITNISIDHSSFLGNTLEEIAGEKAGIIKKNIPIVIGEEQHEISHVFRSVSQGMNSQIVFSESKNTFETDLIGEFQQKNLNTAFTALNLIENQGWNLDDDKVLEGFNNVQSNTGLMGRMQVISEKPKIIVDAAHNLAGFENLLKEIKNIEFNKLLIVYGSSDDKDIISIFKNLPKSATYFLSTFSSKRSIKKEKLNQLADENELNYFLFIDPKKALENAKLNASTDDLILVFGSFYLMEELIPQRKGSNSC